jgi:L-alanine-DL-glutamate epimerase-like enolase superfamily enzyme
MAVRDVLGPDRMLAVDAVQNFNLRPWTVKQAQSLLDALQPADLAWAEEFLPPFDPAQTIELRRRARVHISGGEGITTATVFAQWIKAGAFDIAQPDPTIIGGIGEARRAAEYAALHDVPIAMHVWGSGPTMMANIHLGFTLAGCFTLERPLMHNPLETETLVEDLLLEDGCLRPPSAVGLGIQLTDEVKRKYPYRSGSASAFG